MVKASLAPPAAAGRISLAAGSKGAHLARCRRDGAAERRRLIAGMPVEAFIRTNKRSMLSYMLKPLTDQASRAFREN
jgi:hypothetical protein